MLQRVQTTLSIQCQIQHASNSLWKKLIKNNWKDNGEDVKSKSKFIGRVHRFADVSAGAVKCLCF